ncbi:MAG: hypothetical protein KDD92_17625 [Caldilineaceae bacterium]|nr:hypothetical protein [Caldilineaceae bacterium]
MGKLFRFRRAMSVLLLALLLSAGLTTVHAQEDSGEVSPNQLTMSGTRGRRVDRTVLLRLPAGVTVQAAVPGDLTEEGGGNVLPAAAITAVEPTPDPNADSIDSPRPLVITVDLADVGPGRYDGDLFIVTDGAELPVALTVMVKAQPIWPFFMLLAGLILGMALTHYRRQGRPRDQILREMGELSALMEGDPELTPAATGSIFRQRMDNALLDAQVALRSRTWSDSRAHVEAGRTVWLNWSKDRDNWVAQLTAAEGLTTRVDDRRELFFREIRNQLTQACRAAPDQENADQLYEILENLFAHEQEFEYAENLLKQMQQITNQMPDREQRRPFEAATVEYQRQLENLQPLTSSSYLQDYQALVGEIEVKTREAKDAQSKGITPREAPAASPQPSGPVDTFKMPPLNRRVNPEDGVQAQFRLQIFWAVSYFVALALLAIAGFNELYVAKPIFGSVPWSDYSALFAWGFGAEATRAAVTDLVRNWEVPFGQED